MSGLLAGIGGYLFKFQGHRECFVNYCQVWSFGWDWVIFFNLKDSENVLLISVRSGLLGGIGRSVLTSRSQTMFC